MKLQTLLSDLVALFYPKLCVVCGNPLVEGEEYLCLRCRLQLPATRYPFANNPAHERFKGKAPCEKIMPCLFYNKGGIGQQIVAEIKYKNNPAFGMWMGSYAANNLIDPDFFRDIHCLIPVPLHPKKMRKRRFNQSEMLATGISKATGIPLIADCLYRRIANPTQTKRGSYERWLNTMDIFAVRNRETLADKQTILIDDVLTTGSTLESCINALLVCENIKISILTLSVTL
ncbi:MAG: ComF family protein [Dysgonamonadaceae bacterium]|jgi:predicted amidophosphoribosyltransferase|nr:ComF family protein [Dysgonamonadaceae bacterium]